MFNGGTKVATIVIKPVYKKIKYGSSEVTHAGQGHRILQNKMHLVHIQIP